MAADFPTSSIAPLFWPWSTRHVTGERSVGGDVASVTMVTAQRRRMRRRRVANESAAAANVQMDERTNKKLTADGLEAELARRLPAEDVWVGKRGTCQSRSLA